MQQHNDVELSALGMGNFLIYSSLVTCSCYFLTKMKWKCLYIRSFCVYVHMILSRWLIHEEDDSDYCKFHRLLCFLSLCRKKTACMLSICVLWILEPFMFTDYFWIMKILLCKDGKDSKLDLCIRFGDFINVRIDCEGE